MFPPFGQPGLDDPQEGTRDQDAEEAPDGRLGTARSARSEVSHSSQREAKQQQQQQQVMQEWNLSDPQVANAVLQRKAKLERAERRIKALEKQKDPEYRYKKFLKNAKQ